MYAFHKHINLFSGAISAISKGILFSFYNLLFRTGHYFLGAWKWEENFSFQENENPGLVALILSRYCEIPHAIKHPLLQSPHYSTTL